MKIEDWDRIADVIKVIKEKKLVPDSIKITDYCASVELHIEFKKGGGK